MPWDWEPDLQAALEEVQARASLALPTAEQSTASGLGPGTAPGSPTKLAASRRSAAHGAGGGSRPSWNSSPHAQGVNGVPAGARHAANGQHAQHGQQGPGALEGDLSMSMAMSRLGLAAAAHNGAQGAASPLQTSTSGGCVDGGQGGPALLGCRSHASGLACTDMTWQPAEE